MLRLFRLLTLSLPIVSASTFAQQLTFDHTTFPGSVSIVANMDGNIPTDLVGVPDSAHIQIKTFQSEPVTYAMKNQKFVSQLVVNDFNSDTFPDVLVATSSDFELFLGNGDGTLQTPSHTITAPHRNYLFLSAMDVNHDGKADLVFADLFRVSVKLGHGDGTFDGARTIYDSRVGTIRGIVLGAIGNFDGDQSGDIAIYEEQHLDNGTTVPRLTILYGDRTGSFTALHRALQTRWISSTLTATDVDFDGRSDLVAWGGTLSNPTIEITHGRGSRSPVRQRISITSADTHTTPAPVVADFNLDGKNDLAYLATNGNFSQFQFTYLLGQTGGFSSPQTIALTPNGNNPRLFVAADLTADNRPDWILHTQDLSGSNTLDQLSNTNFSGKVVPRCGSVGLAYNSVSMCTPMDGFVQGPEVRFSINSLTYIPVSRIEIWIDGKKVHQTNHPWSEIDLPLTPGIHRAVAVAVTVDGDTLRMVANPNVH